MKEKNGCIFAAAKNGNVVSRKVLLKLDLRLKIGSAKKTFKKKSNKFCWNKKRVLYLHPLKEESL